MTRESKYASCLNDLDYMQQQMIYAARKHVLAQAESIIVSLESETASQRALIEQQAKEIAGLRDALRELHAIVKGECPSLLNEDSGGDAKLAIEIEALLKEEHP